MLPLVDLGRDTVIFQPKLEKFTDLFIFSYKAWSAIVYQLIPNVGSMEQKLKQFAEIMDADEVLLFEKATFLVIAQAQRAPHDDVHRFEKVYRLAVFSSVMPN